MTLLIISGCVLGISLFIGPLGFLRSAGASLSLSSLGYSLHIAISTTFSRLGVHLGMPLVGFLLDSGTSPEVVGILPLMVSGIL